MARRLTRLGAEQVVNGLGLYAGLGHQISVHRIHLALYLNHFAVLPSRLVLHLLILATVAHLWLQGQLDANYWLSCDQKYQTVVVNNRSIHPAANLWQDVG